VTTPAATEKWPDESAVTDGSAALSSIFTATVAPGSAVPSMRTGTDSVPPAVGAANTGVAVRDFTRIEASVEGEESPPEASTS